MRFSIHKLQQVTTLEAVSVILREHAILDVRCDHPKWPTGEPIRRRFTGDTHGLSFQVQAYDAGVGESLRFIYVAAHSERPKRSTSWFDENGGLRPYDQRVNAARASILFFERDGVVYCAIQTQTESKLRQLLNDLFIPEHWGGVVAATEYHVDTDFYYWILERFMRHDGSLGHDLRVTNLSAYHAETLQETHTLRGDGDEITHLLPTLANIFGNDPFRSIRLAVQYGQNFSMFTFDRSGAAVIEDSYFHGPFVSDTLGNTRRALVAYFIYTQLLPALITAYGEFDKQHWSPKVRHEFIHAIGLEMLKRIAYTLELDRSQTLESYLSILPD